MDFRKVIVVKQFVNLAILLEQKMFPQYYILGFHRLRLQDISRNKPRMNSQMFNMCYFVASTQAFVAKAEIACEHWCLYIERHRALLRVLLTHV